MLRTTFNEILQFVHEKMTCHLYDTVIAALSIVVLVFSYGEAVL